MKIIILAVLILFTFNIKAEEQVTKKQMCTVFHELAKAIVESRYRGVDIIKALDISSGNKLAQQIVIEAYKLPKFSTESNQTEQAVNFANKVYLTCIENL